MMMVMAEALCTKGPVRSERQAKDTARWMRRHGWPFAVAERCDDCGGWHAAANARPVGDPGNERELVKAWAAENLCRPRAGQARPAVSSAPVASA